MRLLTSLFDYQTRSLIVLCYLVVAPAHTQVSLLWESPLTAGDKGALYAPASRNYPLIYVLDTTANTARFYDYETYAHLYTLAANGKNEYPYYLVPDMNSNGHQEAIFANYSLPTYSVRIRDLSTGENLQFWTDATYSHSLWYVLASPGSGVLRLAMLKTNIVTWTSTLVVYSLGVSTSVADGKFEPSPRNAILAQNFPNPFNPETRIRYELPVAARVTLEVFDLAGRLLRSLGIDKQEAGMHEVLWNGKDNAGGQVATGAYLYRLIVNGEVSSKRMLLLR